MPQDVPFGTQLLGQVEKTLNAILGRLLAGSGVTEPQWVTLNVVLATGEPLAIADAAQRTAAALKVDGETARTHLTALVDAGFLVPPEEAADGRTAVTASSRALHASMRAQIGELTARLWGDVPSHDLAVAADVLNTVLDRAGIELARPAT
jgi:DNA-binding MarR family transcriptional regulator